MARQCTLWASFSASLSPSVCPCVYGGGGGQSKAVEIKFVRRSGGSSLFQLQRCSPFSWPLFIGAFASRNTLFARTSPGISAVRMCVYSAWDSNHRDESVLDPPRAAAAAPEAATLCGLLYGLALKRNSAASIWLINVHKVSLAPCVRALSLLVFRLTRR